MKDLVRNKRLHWLKWWNNSAEVKCKHYQWLLSSKSKKLCSYLRKCWKWVSLAFFKIKCSTECNFLLKKKARLDEFDHPAGGTFTALLILAYRHDNSLAPLHAAETAQGLLAFLVMLLSLVLIIPWDVWLAGVRDLFFGMFQWKVKKITVADYLKPFKLFSLSCQAELFIGHISSAVYVHYLFGLSTFRQIMANSACCLSPGTPDCDKQVILLLQNALVYNSNLLFDMYPQTDSCLPAFFWNVSFKLSILFASGLFLFSSLLAFH